MSSRTVELGIGGMTCASCASRVERALTELPGVQAAVNYATGEATAQVPSSVTNDQLVAAVEGTGYSVSLSGKAAELFEFSDFRFRFWVSASIAVPIMLVSMIPNLQFHNWPIATAILALPAVTWAAWPLHRAAILNAKHRAVTMDSLVSLGILVSFGWSTYNLLTYDRKMHTSKSILQMLFSNDPNGTYFEVACSITTLVLLGKVLELSARAKSTAALTQLAALNPTTATVVQGPFNVVKPLAEVIVGDLVFVPAGAQIPVDAQVESGTGHVDSSLITGEVQPISVQSGDSVIGGTALVDGALFIRVSATGQDTVLSAISRLVHQAQTGKAQVTKLVDKVSAIFIPVVFALALLATLFWQVLNHDLSKSIAVGISVLVIACPCALGLATPTAILVGTGRAAQLGILFRGPRALETSEKITEIFLDKTGTLTLGRLSSNRWKTTIDELLFWQIVGSLEQNALHPVAQSLCETALSFAGDIPVAKNVRTFAGKGVQGEVFGVPCAIGSVDWLGLPEGLLAHEAQEYSAQLLNSVVVYQDAVAIGIIGLSELIAPESQAAISALRNLNITPVVISGDSVDRVSRVASDLGIPEFHAQVQPNEKLNYIKSATDAGEIVAMVGDGVNDAAALAAAHLSIAMGDGTEVAASAADVVLLRSNMQAALDAIKLARATMRTIKSNLAWAFAYNIAAIPLAMSGYLNPMLAAAAMAFSSVFVVSNSLRLRKFQPQS